MSFATLVSLLLQLGPMLPAFLTFIETVMAAWKQLPTIPLPGGQPTPSQAGNLKLAAMMPTDADHAEFTRLADMAERHRHELKLGGGNFDGHRIANVTKFLAAHPELLSWALGFFGVHPPAMPPAPPAPATTA